MNITTKYSPGENVWFVDDHHINGRAPYEGRVRKIKTTTGVIGADISTGVEYIVTVEGRPMMFLVLESEAYGSPEALESANPGMSCKGCEKGGEA